MSDLHFKAAEDEYLYVVTFESVWYLPYIPIDFFFLNKKSRMDRIDS
jgi:hypothetical protein